MQCFYFLGKYSADSLKNISAARTEACSRLVEQMGGQIILMHAVLGEYDIVLVINFENNAKALRASLALSKATGINFITLPAVNVTDFDKIADDV